MSTSTSAARWSAGRVARAASTARRRSSATAACSGSSTGLVKVNDDPRSRWSSRSSGNELARRTLAARRQSRKALTTTRCSQVVTAASPRKLSARRYAATSPSWSPSAASWGLPMVRSATAQRRSRCRVNSVAKASGSPATWAARRSTSERSSAGASVTLHHDLGDLAAVLAAHGGQRGQPDHDVAALDGRVDGHHPMGPGHRRLAGELGALEVRRNLRRDVDLDARRGAHGGEVDLADVVVAAEVEDQADTGLQPARAEVLVVGRRAPRGGGVDVDG